MAGRSAGLLAALLAAASGGSIAAQELRLARVPLASATGVDSLAALGFEVADLLVGPSGLEAVVVASAESEARLAGGGFRFAALPQPPRPAPTAYSVYRDFDDPVRGLRVELERLAGTRANVFLDSIGASIEGRPVLAVKIGLPADAPGRPNVLYLATHHAREWISTEVTMALIGYLADSLAATPDSGLLATRDIWVIPVVNPDGYQYTFTERLWRKNRRPNADGTRGVDLNRNYPQFWGFDNQGSSPAPGSETYRGSAPGSEPEVQAVMAFHAAHPPRLAVSYHSYTGLVLHPYGFEAGRIAPDEPVFRALAGTALAPAVNDHLAETSRPGYFGGPSWQLYVTNGEYTEWAYRAYGTLAFTVELTSGCCVGGAYYGFEFPDDSAMVAQVFRDNLPLALAVLRAAGDPASAIGSAGLPVTPPRLEAAWPEAWADATGATPSLLTVRPVSGSMTSTGFTADTLDRGALRRRARASVPELQTAPRGVKVEGPGWSAEVLLSVGSYSWTTSLSDTLTSSVVSLAGRTAVWLQFRTRHAGSLFVPQWQGRVQFSADSGRTWRDVWAVAGSAPVWYPVRVDLPDASGATGARVRFIGGGFPWWLDAVALMTDETQLFTPLAAANDLGVSENPVRGGIVVISWPATLDQSRLSVFTFRGERIHAAIVPPGVSEYDWDLTAGGRPVANGAYIVVVEVAGRVYRRRLFVARR